MPLLMVQIPWESIISHPVFLLVVGAVFASILTPWLTNRWQDHKKALEIKVNLVTRITRLLSEVYAAAVSTTLWRNQQFTAEQFEEFRSLMSRWHIESNVARSEIQAYLGDTSLKNDFNDHFNLLITWYGVTVNFFRNAPKSKELLTRDIEFIKTALTNDKHVDANKITPSFDEKVVEDISTSLRVRTDSIIDKIINAPFKGFSKKR